MKIYQSDLDWSSAQAQNHKKTTRPKQKNVPLVFEQMTSQPPSQPGHRKKMGFANLMAQLWQTGNQVAGYRDQMNPKAEMAHKGREGYIRMLDFLVVT